MTWPALLSSRAFVWVLLPALWAAAYLINLDKRDLRLEEGRRAAPARGMIADGDFALPKLYGEPYLSKPPLYFWVVAAVGAVRGRGSPDGVDELAARLPAAVSALLGAWVLVRWAAGELPAATRALAALLLLSGHILLDKGTLGEIETFFCLLVAGAWAAWWRGHSDAGQTARSWLIAGTLLGLAMLTKGPPALVLFYVPVVAYAAMTRRWSALLSPWHLLAAVFMLAPVAAWLARLGQHPALGGDLAGAFAWWRRQLGVEPDIGHGDYLTRLWWFPVEVARMLLPWGLLAVTMLRRAWAERLGLPPSADPLRRFLACCVVAVSVFFWLWPTARPRHMMAVWFPTCLLAAMTVSAAGAAIPGLWRPLRVFGPLSAWATAAVGFAGLAVSAALAPANLGWAGVGAAACVAASAAMASLTARTGFALSGLSLSANAAVAVLAGWAMIASLSFRPFKAATDRPRAFFESVRPRIREDRPIYTTLTFPVRGELFYNHQFYFGTRLRALEVWRPLPGGGGAVYDWSALAARLPVGGTCTVLMRSEDLAELARLPQFALTRLNPDPPGTKPPDGVDLQAVEVLRKL
jgi:4-amino-4-deoxy-L-arabinose transferase-like glycosyltransferase